MKEQGLWEQRWVNGNIGWHRLNPNDNLLRHANHIIEPEKTVLIPLCGKSKDIIWLAEQGMNVIGVELVEQAIVAFFSEWGVVPKRHQRGTQIHYQYKSVTVYLGNFFDFAPHDIGPINCIYDRAALVAMHPTNRKQYIAQHLSFLQTNSKLLLITYDMPVPRTKGPPYPVGREDIPILFQDYQSIVHLEEIKHTQETEPKLKKRGVAWSKTNIWLITA